MILNDLEGPELAVILDIRVVVLLADQSFSVIEGGSGIRYDRHLGWFADKERAIILLETNDRRRRSFCLLVLNDLSMAVALLVLPPDGDSRVRRTQIDTNDTQGLCIVVCSCLCLYHISSN